MYLIVVLLCNLITVLRLISVVLIEKDLSMLPIIIADVDIEDSLIAMCKQAEILLNCVGPVCRYILQTNYPEVLRSKRQKQALELFKE